MRGLSWIGRSQEVAEAAMSRDAPEGRLREDKRIHPRPTPPGPEANKWNEAEEGCRAQVTGTQDVNVMTKTVEPEAFAISGIKHAGILSGEASRKVELCVSFI